MNIWIPKYGETDVRAWKIDQRVREYDSRLMFGRNEDTGDWCIFIKMPTPRDPYPVIGFQNRIPEPDEALDRLKAADTMRHGDAVYREVLRSQEEYRKSGLKKVDEASADSAERIEFMLRKHGKSPIIKSTSKGVNANDSND